MKKLLILLSLLTLCGCVGQQVDPVVQAQKEYNKKYELEKDSAWYDCMRGSYKEHRKSYTALCEVYSSCMANINADENSVNTIKKQIADNLGIDVQFLKHQTYENELESACYQKAYQDVKKAGYDMSMFD